MQTVGSSASGKVPGNTAPSNSNSEQQGFESEFPSIVEPEQLESSTRYIN